MSSKKCPYDGEPCVSSPTPCANCIRGPYAYLHLARRRKAR